MMSNIKHTKGKAKLIKSASDMLDCLIKIYNAEFTYLGLHPEKEDITKVIEDATGMKIEDVTNE